MRLLVFYSSHLSILHRFAANAMQKCYRQCSSMHRPHGTWADQKLCCFNITTGKKKL